MKHFFISIILCVNLLFHPQFVFSNTDQDHHTLLEGIKELQKSMDTLEEALSSIDLPSDHYEETDPSAILSDENTNSISNDFNQNLAINYLSKQEGVRDSIKRIYEDHRDKIHSFSNENELMDYLIDQEDVRYSAEQIYRDHKSFFDNVLFDDPPNTAYAYMIYDEGPNIIFNNSEEEEPEPQSGTGHAVFAIIWLIVVIACSIFTGNAHCKNTDKGEDK